MNFCMRKMESERYLASGGDKANDTAKGEKIVVTILLAILVGSGLMMGLILGLSTATLWVVANQMQLFGDFRCGLNF